MSLADTPALQTALCFAFLQRGGEEEDDGEEAEADESEAEESDSMKSEVGFRVYVENYINKTGLNLLHSKQPRFPALLFLLTFCRQPLHGRPFSSSQPEAPPGSHKPFHKPLGNTSPPISESPPNLPPDITILSRI